MLHNENDTLYVFNFWATWCKPCVAELPYFEKLNKIYASEKLKIILVSLDFADEIDTRVMPFLLKNNIQSKVILLDESNPNTFIDKVSTQWSGAIPATYIFKGKLNSFYEKSFNYEELESIVNLKLNE
jgi:thiol-disulfide isomerase/thioredoxin